MITDTASHAQHEQHQHQHSPATVFSKPIHRYINITDPKTLCIDQPEMSRTTPSSFTAVVVFISVAFFLGGAVGFSRTAPRHQMLKPAAEPVPPCHPLCVAVPIGLAVLVLFHKFVDWME